MTVKKAKNILIIHADQHRWDCIGAYGNKEVNTPALDMLAADAVRHDNCFCTHPVCTPSRYSFLSGLHVCQHRGWTNHSTLPADILTFPKILSSNGWNTAAVGKMHFTPTYLDVGFQNMILAEQNGPGRWEDDYHADLMKHDLCDQNDLEDQVDAFRNVAGREYYESCGCKASNLPKEFHSTSWIGKHALHLISQWDEGEQNLLMVGFIKPHHPFDPPSDYLEQYDPQTLTLLPGWTETTALYEKQLDEGFFPNADLTEEKVKNVMAGYYASISHMDSVVGKIIEHLKSRGLYEDTMIIYASDHGDYMGFHHMLLKANHMYDPLTRVPLIIKYPGSYEGGTSTRKLCSTIDITREILNCAGVADHKELLGTPPGRFADGRSYVFCEDNHGKQMMIRSARYKLILNDGLTEDLFFDLLSDPLEMKNLYGHPKHQSVIAEMMNAADMFKRDLVPDYRTFVDEEAPQIKTEHKQPDIVQEYYTHKMQTRKGRTAK